MRFLSAGEVCDLVRIPYQTLNYWVVQGLITPAYAPGGAGRSRLFRLTDVVAVTVGRGLRSKGYPLRVAADAMRFLGSFTEESLEACFSDGRKYLLLTAGEVTERLVSEPEMTRSKVMAKIAELSGIPPVALDVQKVYEFTVAALDNPEAAAEPVEVMA